MCSLHSFPPTALEDPCARISSRQSFTLLILVAASRFINHSVPGNEFMKSFWRCIYFKTLFLLGPGRACSLCGANDDTTWRPETACFHYIHTRSLHFRRGDRNRLQRSSPIFRILTPSGTFLVHFHVQSYRWRVCGLFELWERDYR